MLPSPIAMLVAGRRHACQLIYDIFISFQHCNEGWGISTQNFFQNTKCFMSFVCYCSSPPDWKRAAEKSAMQGKLSNPSSPLTKKFTSYFAIQPRAFNTINEYQSKICHKFNNSCWNLSFYANKFMLLSVVSLQNPPKVDT